MADSQLSHHKFDLLFDPDEEVKSLESILEEKESDSYQASPRYLDVHQDSKMAEVTLSSVPTSLRGSENVSLTDSVTPLETNEEHVQMIFDICRTEDGKISVKLFLEELQRFGIYPTDPRLENMMNKLNNWSPSSAYAVENLNLEPGLFKTVLSENIVLVNKALQNSFIIPGFEAFCENLTSIYEKCKDNKTGKCGDYIPQLGQYGDDDWGVAVCTIDGQRFSIGDADTNFTIQSTSQVVTYAICLTELGEERVHKFQGREPSGRMFNEIALDHQNKPHNPLVNSGAILSAALILQEVMPELGSDIAAKYDFVFNFFKRMAGGEYIGFNNSAFLSERQACDRNNALAHFLAENKCMPSGVDIKKTMDFYSQICSLEMNCESLSVLASTLANGGVCPITGECIINPYAVQHVKCLMYSCGMYNYSGQFAFDVGLPAKSGVSGVMMVVIPNVMGIALWSPLLDKLGNSVRGKMFCQELVKAYSFHRFDNLGSVTEKLDPTYRKCQTAGETVVQILLAAACGDKLFLQRAWLKDIDLNVADYDGRTALHLAASEGHIETVKFLLNVVKVNPEPEDRWKQNPHGEALRFGHFRLASYIKAYIEEHPEQKYESEEFDEDLDDFEEEEETEGDESGIKSPYKNRSRRPSGVDGNMIDAGLLGMNSRLRLSSNSLSVSSGNEYLGNISRLCGLLAPPEALGMGGEMNAKQPNMKRRASICISTTSPSTIQSLPVSTIPSINTRSPTPGGSPSLPRASITVPFSYNVEEASE